MSTLVAAVSAIVYVVAALGYARVALSEAGPIRRLAFMASMLILIGIVFSTVDEHDWIAGAFSAYVMATVYGWRASAKDAVARGKKATGFARALMR